ncbi:MAG: ribonucleotide reductase N-terminal alpha domain-containing protein, partial [Longimicrobiales bacterium]|nr:ribonucleotide reductase N-terminal alpha domain-containing protein [Longimicrobiales bacterium]
MTRKPASSPASAVLPDDLSKADLTENARIIMGKRYLKKNEDGQPIEEPEQMFWRVARVIAEVDAE